MAAKTDGPSPFAIYRKVLPQIDTLKDLPSSFLIHVCPLLTLREYVGGSEVVAAGEELDRLLIV